MDFASQVENHLHNTEPRWFAVYTRFKREKVVWSELKEKGIEGFLPIQKLLRQYGRKRRWVELPLFSCYVFVKITKKEYVSVLSTQGVVRFIHFSRNIISIPESEIQLIKRILKMENLIEVEQHKFQVGEAVEIIAGSLLGMKGKLLEIQGKNKVLIELVHLGYTLKMDLPKSILKRIEFISHKQLKK